MGEILVDCTYNIEAFNWRIACVVFFLQLAAFFA